jgi:hypothetical protein
LPDNAKFPSLQEIGEDLVNILDVLQIKCVIGMGEGAGANIMFRFGMMHVTRCLGIICVNPTGASASMKVTHAVPELEQPDKSFAYAEKSFSNLTTQLESGFVSSGTEFFKNPPKGSML